MSKRQARMGGKLYGVSKRFCAVLWVEAGWNEGRGIWLVVNILCFGKRHLCEKEKESLRFLGYKHGGLESGFAENRKWFGEVIEP